MESEASRRYTAASFITGSSSYENTAGPSRNRSGTDDSSGPGRNVTCPLSTTAAFRLKMKNNMRPFMSDRVTFHFV